MIERIIKIVNDRFNGYPLGLRKLIAALIGCGFATVCLVIIIKSFGLK